MYKLTLSPTLVHCFQHLNGNAFQQLVHPYNFQLIADGHRKLFVILLVSLKVDFDSLFARSAFNTASAMQSIIGYMTIVGDSLQCNISYQLL